MSATGNDAVNTEYFCSGCSTTEIPGSRTSGDATYATALTELGLSALDVVEGLSSPVMTARSAGAIMLPATASDTAAPASATVTEARRLNQPKRDRRPTVSSRLSAA